MHEKGEKQYQSRSFGGEACDKTQGRYGKEGRKEKGGRERQIKGGREDGRNSCKELDQIFIAKRLRRRSNTLVDGRVGADGDREGGKFTVKHAVKV